MQLAWGPEEEAFRAELVEFLDEHVPHEADAGFDYADSGEREDADLIPGWSRVWQATLFDNGWMIPAYPPELGGRNCTPVQTLIYLEEMARRRVPRSMHFPGYAIVAPSLLEFGGDDQRELVPAAIRGDTIWCIGMSEPNAGSDLASLSTRAEVHDDHFVVNGQKVWTSYAMAAQKCFCYVRTDPSAPKHKGISLLILDMDTPGIEIRPLRHISGAANFAEVFFSDVVVPRGNLVGSLNDGWRITQGSLAHERAGLWVEGVSRLETTIHGLVNLATRRGLIDDPIVRRRLAELSERAASLRSLGYKGFSSFAQGSSAPEHSFMKMATSELGKEVWEYGMELQG
ncbi:MAG TPA: acyl-CoA dehydrogenase family protein, partial [Acidimicrobiia bacterium]|nr:acyl-CoA dehydrogenase family protein [Acidimicrobiia bacterium]